MISGTVQCRLSASVAVGGITGSVAFLVSLPVGDLSKNTDGVALASGSVNMVKRGVVAAVRVVRNHYRNTSIVFLLYLQQFVSTPPSLLYATKVATEL